jgi:hypothetical protein
MLADMQGASLALRIASGGWALLFVFAAAVQWNDPDPVRWTLGYGAVAAVSAAVAFGARPLVPAVLVLAGVLVAFGFFAPSLRHATPEALASFGMSGAAEEEEAREAIGLGLAAAWMGVVVVALVRGRR